MKTGTFGRLFSSLAAFTILFVVGSTLAAPGDLYVSDVAGKQILKFTPAGTKSVFVSGLDGVGPLAFDRAGNLFVTASSQPDAVLKFAPGAVKSTFISGLSSPGWLAFDRAGNLFVTESFGDTGDISKITPSGTKSTFTSGGHFSDLIFDPYGSNLFTSTADATNPDGPLVLYNPDGTAHSFRYSVGPGLAFAGGFIYTTGGGNIAKSFPVPGSLAPDYLFASGLDGPLSLAFDSAGNLFVSETGSGSILKFAPDGTRSTFASGLEGDAYLAFEPAPDRLRNISARGLVGTGDDALIGGFIVGGSALLNNVVVVRALGPSLSQAGVTNALSDPVLELHDASGALIATNDDWQYSQSDVITATGLAPSNPKESAIYAALPDGSYTVVVRGAGDTTGVALIEVYSIAQ